MKRIILTAVVALGLAGPAMAQRQGDYGVEGRTPDGQTYTGTLQMIPSGQNTWLVNWRVGGDSASGVGLMIPEGPLLVVGYLAGRETGVVVYAVQPDGRLLGSWTQGQGGGIGTEVLTPGGSAGK